VKVPLKFTKQRKDFNKKNFKEDNIVVPAQIHTGESKSFKKLINNANQVNGYLSTAMKGS